MQSTEIRDCYGRIAVALKLAAKSVRAIIELLEAGNTVPFIARYRKEATDGLDEVAIRAVKEALASLIELEERRGTILSQIEQQGVLTPALKQRLLGAVSKSELASM